MFSLGTVAMQPSQCSITRLTPALGATHTEVVRASWVGLDERPATAFVAEFVGGCLPGAGDSLRSSGRGAAAHGYGAAPTAKATFQLAEAVTVTWPREPTVLVPS
jgi:hypothetical protein